MKKTIFLSLIMVLTASALLTSCNPDNDPVQEDSDPTKFSTSSIVGIWVCVGSDNKTYDILAGEYEYNWDYDPDAETYDVEWYFNIGSDSKMQYIEVKNEDKKGEYRKSDGYLHIAEDSQWRPLVDANYIFDVKRQAIRCPSGKALGFTLEMVEYLLGSDTIFYVKRYELDEAAIFDNTGYLQSQYVIRAKGIKKDL